MLAAEEEANGAGRHRAQQGQWFRLHGHSKTGHDAAIVKLATALLDADIRRSMYKHPWLSQDKYRGQLQLLASSQSCIAAWTTGVQLYHYVHKLCEKINV